MLKDGEPGFLELSRTAILAAIRAMRDALGISLKNLALGGFSQGATWACGDEFCHFLPTSIPDEHIPVHCFALMIRVKNSIGVSAQSANVPFTEACMTLVLFEGCIDFGYITSFVASGAAAAMDVALSLLPEVPAALGFFSGSLMCRRRWRQLLDGHEQAFQVWALDCKIINK